MHKTLFTSVKNEAPFLLEWVAYHRAIGFDQIIIVSNDSDDGTTEFLEALAAHNIVHHIYHTLGPDDRPQGKAALLGNDSELLDDGDWVIWLDADEFLNIHVGGGRVEDLVAAIGGAQGMLIPWRVFGDSGHAEFPGSFISSDFTGAAARDFKENFHIKVFYRFKKGSTKLSHCIHRPGLSPKAGYKNTDFLNANAEVIDEDYAIHDKWLSGQENQGNFNVPEIDYCWQLAQINHYMVRTPEHFALKRSRGRGFARRVNGKTAGGIRYSSNFYQKNNRNEEEDRSILRFQQATRQEEKQLLRLPGVAKAQREALARNAEKIAAMRHEKAARAVAAEEVDQSAAESSGNLEVPSTVLSKEAKDLVGSCYAEARVVLEYGSGGSTLLAAAHKPDLVVSVESNRAWTENLDAILNRDYPDVNARLWYVDIGETKAWGRPKNNRACQRFSLYSLSVWDQPWLECPDVVLVDGPFRVGCFMATLLRITQPVTLLFADYRGRSNYAWVERFAKPVALVNRMARFELEPMRLPTTEFTESVQKFSDPD